MNIFEAVERYPNEQLFVFKAKHKPIPPTKELGVDIENNDVEGGLGLDSRR
jgi:hypothetical protein